MLDRLSLDERDAVRSLCVGVALIASATGAEPGTIYDALPTQKAEPENGPPLKMMRVCGGRAA